MRDDYYTAANDSFADYDSGEQQASGVTPQAILRLLRGRWHWAILLGVILAVGGGYVGLNFEKPEYTAQSDIVVNPGYNVPVEITDYSTYEPYWNMVLTEMDLLEAFQTAEIAMQQPAWQQAMDTVGPEVGEMSPEGFISNLTLYPPHNNDRSLEVLYIHENPVIAQAGLNSLLQAYRTVRKQDQTQGMDESLKLLQDRRRNLELRERQIREQMRLVIPDSEYLTINRRLSSKLGELANMEFKLAELELILGPFLDPENQQAKLTLQEMMKQDPEMIALLDQKKALEDEFIYQTEILRRGETMASVVQVKRQLSRVDRQILELESKWIVQGQETDLPMPQQVVDLMSRHKALSAKVTELQAETNDLATRIAAVKEDELELGQTQASIRNVLDEIDKLKDTGDLLDKNNLTRVEIGLDAQLPSAPSNADKRVMMAGAGSAGGMGLGFGLVMLIGLMDRRLRHVSDTAANLPGTSVLGILPTLPADLKDPEQAETASHCVHHIRTLLQIGGTNRVFSITSPAAGSGKSSLATALGMSFAATGSRTLVIDSDLVGAGISRRMGSIVHESLDVVIRHKGMMSDADLARAQTLAASQQAPLEDILLQENLLNAEQIETAKRLQMDTSLGLLDACAPGRLRSCVAATGLDQFFVLPVGKAKPSDASRLSPAAMRELVRQAREAFDIVLIDTGPVLGSLEASIAAAESDATVMIVSRGDNRSIAVKSLDQLRSVHADIAGIVFNHALESDLAHGSYASLVSQERRPSLGTRKRKLDKARSARLGPLGTAVASCSDDDDDSQADSLMITTNGDASQHR
jgi:Mrp family chromosome partitioning ATPase